MSTPLAPVAMNPFAAEAVSTYGVTSAMVTCTGLKYMQAVEAELNDYLRAYPLEDKRYGGAFGVRGVHGSGKTHVLSWLGNSLRGWKSITGRVLYGKCDSTKLFDLYKQLMKQLEREPLIELIQLALLNLARDRVRMAKITESLAEQLQSINGLQALQAGHDLDVEQLRQQLVAILKERMGATDIARMIMAVPDPTFGALAHRWLTGHEVDDLVVLGVAHQLRTLPGLDDTIDADTASITAFTAIAALHQLAGVPLLILVDQLEVLLRIEDPDSFNSLSSVIKKAVEACGTQSALLFIAGTPEAWDKLPRDVSARLRRREQFVVGGLTLEETKLLLQAYTEEGLGVGSFTAEAAVALHELAGGNPREIIRISHHAFERTRGALQEADKKLLLDSAQRSGTIADRVTWALSIVDEVLPAFGKMWKELATSDQVIDRAVLNDAGAMTVALIVVTATDPLDEVDSARRVHSVKAYCKDHWPQARSLVVSVGYSSAEVRGMLGPAGTIMFKEKTFASELRTWLLTAQRDAAEAPAAPIQALLAESLEQISKRLEQLEKQRSNEAVRVGARFAEGTQRLAAPMVDNQRFTTRREVLEALLSLRGLATERRVEDERKLLRSILIANEASVQNAKVEEYGDLFTEALALEQAGGPALSVSDRLLLIELMRESLEVPKGLLGLFQRRRQVWIALGALVAGFIATGVISSLRAPTYLPLPPPYDFVSMLPWLFLALILCGAVFAGFVWARHRRSERQLQDSLWSIKNALRTARNGPSLRNRYPQA